MLTLVPCLTPSLKIHVHIKPAECALPLEAKSKQCWFQHCVMKWTAVMTFFDLCGTETRSLGSQCAHSSLVEQKRDIHHPDSDSFCQILLGLCGSSLVPCGAVTAACHQVVQGAIPAISKIPGWGNIRNNIGWFKNNAKCVLLLWTVMNGQTALELLPARTSVSSCSGEAERETNKTDKKRERVLFILWWCVFVCVCAHWFHLPDSLDLSICLGFIE